MAGFTRARFLFYIFSTLNSTVIFAQLEHHSRLQIQPNIYSSIVNFFEPKYSFIHYFLSSDDVVSSLLLLCGKYIFFSFFVLSRTDKQLHTSDSNGEIISYLPLCARLVDKLCVHKLCADVDGCDGSLMLSVFVQRWESSIFHELSSSRKSFLFFDVDIIRWLREMLWDLITNC